MNVLFLTSRRFFVHEDRVYTEGAIQADAGVRYTKYFDDVVVIGRVSDLGEKDVAGMTDVTHTGIRVLGTPQAPEFVKKRGVHRAFNGFFMDEVVPQFSRIIIRAPNRLGVALARSARKHRIPYAVDVCACAWDSLWNYGSLAGKLYAPFSFFNTRRLVRNAPFAIYVTEHFLQRRYPNNGGIVTFASNVELPQIGEEVMRDRFERMNNRSLGTSQPIVFGTIGSMQTKAKGTADALRAVARIKEGGINAVLRILGQGDPGPYQDLARELGIYDSVNFFGVFPPGDVMDWLRHIDFYIHPSYQEGLPRAVVEAMAVGLPIVASTAGGTPELIDNQFLHQAGDVDQMVKIIRLATNDHNLAEIGRTNFETAKNYSRKNLEARRDAFFEQFING